MISLIVATINRVAELDRLLSSLDEQSYRDFEVIVVDQNSDHRLAPLLSAHNGLAICHLQSERGLSRARNVGLRVAQGDILAIPDDDCWYPQHLLASVAAWFESHSGFGLLGTTLRDAENKTSGSSFPAKSRRCTKGDIWRCVTSGTLFMRRSVSAAVGGFNEDFGVGAPSEYQGAEEKDYVMRALKNGFQMWYEASLTVHHPPINSIERLRKTTYSYALSEGRVQRMHHYPLHRLGGHLIRSLGGAAVSLCHGDLARTRVYVLRGAGQLVGYVSGARDRTTGASPASR
ncbi:MAG: glycosyltransferase family A protein [Terriglobales bacterium]